MIKAVLFDLDGTLYDRDALVQELVADQHAAFGVELEGISRERFVAQVPTMSWHGRGQHRAVTRLDVRLIGPGGAGKSTIGALLAERLGQAFFDLDLHLAGRIGDIGAYIARHGYHVYARANVDTYCAMRLGRRHRSVTALSSGFMTYPRDIHPEYPHVCEDIARHPNTFVLLPSLDVSECVAETVRRQLGRPFGRSPVREEAVIRTRFDIYMAVPARKITTMRPSNEAVDEIVRALASQAI